MSTNVDNRIVNMNYNGGDFDRGVERSAKSFDMFKQTIDSGGGAISEALSSLDAKISAKGIAIATTISRMTNNVLNSIKRLSTEWIRGPMKDGFSEYETKMGALFNIFNAVKNKGSSFDNVTDSINMLNYYADKTIYNFSQMTTNFQRFTTAGKSLTQAGGMVVGLSNLAASVGATNDSLSRATYQMSQVNGFLNLMDYNSLVNAGMASEAFRETMQEVSKESDRMMTKFKGKDESNSAAVYFEKAVKAGLSFREMISDRVFTEDDLTETMRRFSIETDATQGALDELRKTFADVSKSDPITPDMLAKLKQVRADSGGFASEMVRVANSGKATIKSLNGVAHEAMSVDNYLAEATKQGLSFSQMAKDTNFSVGDLQKTLDRLSVARSMYDAATQIRTFSQMIDTLKEDIGSGWGETYENIFGDLEQATALWSGLANAINNLIGPLDASRNAMLAFWNANGGRTAVIQGFVNVFNALGNILRSIGIAFKTVFGILESSSLVDASLSFQKFTEKLIPTQKTIDLLTKGFIILFNAVKVAGTALSFTWEIIKAVSAPIVDLIKNLFGIGKEIAPMFDGLSSGVDIIVNMATILQQIGVGLYRALAVPLAVVASLFQALSGIISGIAGVFGRFNISIEGSQSTLSIFIKVSEAVSSAIEWLGDRFKAVGSGIKTFLEGLDYSPKALFKWATNMLPKSFDDIIKIIDLVIKGKLVGAINNMADAIKSVTGSLKNLGGEFGKALAAMIDSIKQPLNKANPEWVSAKLLAFGVAMLTVGYAIKMVGGVDTKAAAKSMVALGSLLSMMDLSVRQLLKWVNRAHFKRTGKEVVAIMRTMGLVAIEMGIAIKILGSADPQTVLPNVMALMLVMRMLVKLYQKILEMNTVFKRGKEARKAFKELANVFLIMGITLAIISRAPTDGVIASSLAIMAIIGVLAKTVKSLQHVKHVSKATKALKTMSIGLSFLAIGMGILARNNFVSIIASALAMSIVISVVSKAFSGLGTSKVRPGAIRSFTTGLAILAVGLAVLAKQSLVGIGASALAMIFVISSVARSFLLIDKTRVRSSQIAAFTLGLTAISVGMAILARQSFENIGMTAASLFLVISSIALAFMLMDQTRVKPAQIAAFTLGITAISVGMAILARQSFENIIASAVSLSAVVLVIAAAFKIINGSNIKAAKALALTAGITIISLGMAVLATNDWQDILAGALGLSSVVLAAVLAMKLATGANIKATKMALFTTGIAIMAIGMSALAGKTWSSILAAGVAMSAVVLAVAGAMKLAGGSAVKTASILAFAIGVSILAGALAKLAGFDASSLLVGAGAIAAVVFALAGAMILLGSAASVTITGAAALIIMATGVYILAAALEKLSTINFEDMKLALIAFAVALVAIPVLFVLMGLAIAAVTAILTPLAPALLVVGAGLVELGLGAIMCAAAVALIMVSVESLLQIFMQGPEAVQRMVDGLHVFAQNGEQIMNDLKVVVAVGVATIVGSIFEAVYQLVNQLGNYLAPIIDLVLQIILGVLQAIEAHIADIVYTAVNIVTQICIGLANAAPQLIDAAIYLVLQLVYGIVLGIENNLDLIENIIHDLIIVVVEALAKALRAVWNSLKQIGKAVWDGILEGLRPGSKKGVLDTVIANLENSMTGALDSFDGGSEFLEKYTKNTDDAAESTVDLSAAAGKLKGALTGLTDSFGKDGGGLGGKIKEYTSIDKFLPDGSFDGSAQGEDLGDSVVDGYSDATSDTSKGGKKTKAATENLVKKGVTDPLSKSAEEAKNIAYLVGSGVVDSVAAGLSDTSSVAKAMNNMGSLTGLITSVAKTSRGDALKNAKREELQALDDADQGVIKAYEEMHKAKAEALEKKNEALWKQTAANMSQDQYEALVEAQKTPRTALYDASLKEIEELSDTWIGALTGSMEELGLAATPLGNVLGVFSKGVEESANTIEEANIPSTLKTMANAFSLLGKIVPQISSFTDAFGAFSLSLSEIGQNGTSPVVTMTKALSSLGMALLDIAIDKAQQAMNAMGQIASTAASSIANVVTSAAQVTVDVVVDVASWALKGGEGELSDLGDIIGTLVDSVGGATVQAGADILGAAASGAMEMMGAGAFSGVATAITGMFGTLGQMVTSALGKLIPLVYDALKNLAKKVAPDWAITFFGSFQKIFKKFFNKLFGETLDGDDQAKWFREHGKQLGEVYVEGLSSISGTGEQVVNETTNWLDELAAKLKSTGGLFANLAAQLIESFSTAWKSFNGWLLGIGESLVGFITAGASGNSAVIYDYILDFIYTLTGGFFGKKADINNLGNNMLSWLLSDDGQIADGIQRLVKDLFNLLTFGIFSRGDEAVLIGKLMNDRILAGLAATPQEALVQIITTIISALLQIVGDLLPKLIVIGAQVSRAVFDGMLDFMRQGGFWKIIGAIIKGLWKGFNTSEMNIWKIGWEIAKALWEGFLVKLGIRSPSKEFEASVGYMVDGLVEGAKNGQINLGKIGSDIASFLWNGFLDLFKLDTISTKISNICTDIIESIKSLIDRFKDPGKSWAEKLWDGFKGLFSITTISETIGNIVTGIKDAIKDALTKMWDAGRDMASNLWEGFKNFLGIKSPSKVFSQGGKYCIEGLAKGLGNTDAIDTAMYDLADAMKDSVSLFEDINPTITPIIDLDVIRKRAKAVQGMFGGVELSHSLASAIVDRQNGTKSTSKADKQESGSVTYQQIINSPTPLTPRQIYRQTGTLLEIKKGKLA